MNDVTFYIAYFFTKVCTNVKGNIIVHWLLALTGIACATGIIYGILRACRRITGPESTPVRWLEHATLLPPLCIASVAFIGALDIWVLQIPGDSEVFPMAWRILSGVTLGTLFTLKLRREPFPPGVLFRQEWPHLFRLTKDAHIETRRIVLGLGSVVGIAFGGIAGSVILWNFTSANTLWPFAVFGGFGGALCGFAIGALLDGFTWNGFCIGAIGTVCAVTLTVLVHKLLGNVALKHTDFGEIIFGCLLGGTITVSPYAVAAGWFVGVALMIHILFGRGVAYIASRLLIALTFRTVLCPECLRLTNPQSADYNAGQRFCEHCGRLIGAHDTADKLAAVFGAEPPGLPSEYLHLFNPDVGELEQRLDIAEIHIHPATSDPRLVERFLTFLLSYPPQAGHEAIRIISYGPLQDLGRNLRNVLYNTFQQIEERPETHG